MFYLFILSCILFFCLLFLSVCKIEKNIQRFLEFFFILIILITASSREFFQTNSDDMIRYYDSYLVAAKSDYLQYIYIYGREFLFETFNWFIAWITSGVLNVNQYTFLIILPTICFSYFFYKTITPNENVSIALLCLLVPGLMLIETQLVRQTMGYFIFLYSMTISRRSYKILLILAAIMIHATTFFLALIWYFSDKLLIKFFRTTKGIFVLPFFISCYLIGLKLTNHYQTIVANMASLPFIGFKADFLLTIDLVPFVFAKLYFVFFALVCFICTIVFSFKNDMSVTTNRKIVFNLNELQVKHLTFSYALCCLILLFSFIGQLVDRFIVLTFSSFPIFIIYFLSAIKIKKVKSVSFYPWIVFVFFLYYIFMLLQSSHFSLFNGSLG
ncbi:MULTISPECIES: EpsG family protein [Shewanella]|uniref:EpsG family protein n=1 Tax=Shewanella TaxID=22 RepID=UPI001AAF6F2C|nr:EpsG family protein [Shewanella algae]MBO2661847.1 EpsG family protein [Shewanella algae]MCL1053027.1 EpsG family protein [Shewanella algae]